MPDRFIDQNKPEAMIAATGLDSAGIVTAVFAAFGRPQTVPATRLA
jgi:1-deoxy-D-xylulose-5-phosphate synthase